MGERQMISKSLFGKLQKNLLIPVVAILIFNLAAPLGPMRPSAAQAGEGGSSTYTPGTNAWTMGFVPPPGLYFRYIFLFYKGQADAVAEFWGNPDERSYPAVRQYPAPDCRHPRLKSSAPTGPCLRGLPLMSIEHPPCQIFLLSNILSF
jgi:hypothetical protein